MKIYEVDYKIKSKNNTNYTLISDLHGNFSIELANIIAALNTKFVVISGDILNGKEWTNDIKLVNLRRFLKTIATSHPIILALGNHDLIKLSNEGFKNFKNLEKLGNIYPIYNESIMLDNERFTNVLPSIKTFSYPRQESKQTIDELCDKFSKVNAKSNYIEHLVAHNPYHFKHKEVQDLVKDFDVIETGHFHDGWVPTVYLDKKYSYILNKGIQEVICDTFTNNNPYRLKISPRKDFQRGITYVFEDGYFTLLPNSEIYYYSNRYNAYTMCTKDELNRRLIMDKTPAVAITGAINTFFSLQMYYPYITNIELVKNEPTFKGVSRIKNI